MGLHCYLPTAMKSAMPTWKRSMAGIVDSWFIIYYVTLSNKMERKWLERKLENLSKLQRPKQVIKCMKKIKVQYIVVRLLPKSIELLIYSL